MIQIWQYEDSPEKYRFMYDDVDWIAFVPDNMDNFFDTFFNREMDESNSFRVDGGTVYIHTH